MDLALGPDITFHLTHYLTNSDITYTVLTTKNRSSRTNNLNGNIGYDWTDNIRVDIATAMNLMSVRYRDKSANDSDDLNVNLNTTFIYALTKDTDVELATDISKSSNMDPASRTTESARINRHFGVTLKHEFEKLFKPQLTLQFNRDNEYYPNPESNKKHWRWELAPYAELRTSDALTLTFSFSYANEEIDAFVDLDPEDWSRHEYYAASTGITYTIFQGLTANANVSTSHHVITRDRRRRVVEVPDETFFNVSTGLNYSF